MKVNISEQESYELKIADEMSFSDFDKLVQKLNVVVSMLKGETSAKQISGPKTKFYTRAAVVEMLYAYQNFGKDSPQFIEAMKKYDTTLVNIQGQKHKWIRRHKITPQEIGLTEFPFKV
jgi:hypothetical protein